jgi:NADP-dependent 3-hydroxy acid dehydrogenase YdfG
MDERVFLITGASSGIGAATARQAAAAGYRLALLARTTEALESLAAELGGQERALAITCDVTEWEQVERAVETTLRAFGRIDVVFANAGFGAVRGFLTESPEHWRSMILTNVYGAALTIRATVTALESTRGHLLVTGSVAGHVNIEGSVYSATKHAVGAMAESARKELHERGIRVTLISPDDQYAALSTALGRPMSHPSGGSNADGGWNSYNAIGAPQRASSCSNIKSHRVVRTGLGRPGRDGLRARRTGVAAPRRRRFGTTRRTRCARRRPELPP